MPGFHLLSENPSIRRDLHHVPETPRRGGPDHPAPGSITCGNSIPPASTEADSELNQPFTPHLIVLDGVDAFVDGGPATGKTAKGEVFLASTDRVAIDAVGVAVLKNLGSNTAIMGTKIFDQEQMAQGRLEAGTGGFLTIRH